MYSHPDNAAKHARDRHHEMRADIGSHRRARQLRDLAKAVRRAQPTPHRPRRAWRPVLRLRARARA